MRTQSTPGGRRARVCAGSPDTQQVALAMDEWMERRPPVQGESSLGNGGMLLRYAADPQKPSAPRNEAFFMSHPGLLVAALTVDPQLEAQAGGPPSAERVAAQLAAPPIGMLTDIWQDADGSAFIERAGHLHLAGADGRWTPLRALVMRNAPTLQMIGRQADGAVYVHDGRQLWRAHATMASAAPIAQIPPGSVVRVDANGAAQELHDGCLTSHATNTPSRTVELWRPRAAGPGFEPSPAMPVDLLPLPGGIGDEALILDDKGRVYHADLSGSGSIQAQRLELPKGRQHQDGWVVTRMGLAADDTVHLLLENEQGRRAVLQRPPGQDVFSPAYLLDQPMLLIRADGLHAPADSEVSEPVLLDGHARLGHIDGVLHYQAAPGQPWTRPTGDGGAPLTDLDVLQTSPFGFIDRRSAFALLKGKRQLVELKLNGRTTWLPAHPAPSTPSGGPLAVVPDRVHVDTLHLADFDEPVQQLAVDIDQTLAVLSENNTLHLIPPGQPALELKGLQLPMAIAIGLDGHLHVLDHVDGVGPQLKRHVADHTWHEVALILPSEEPPTSLRSTRTGQLQLRIGERWHALLPSMTAADGTRQASRVAPEPAPEEPAADGTQSGTNAILNARQPTRISTRHHDAAVTSTLLGTTSSDPLTARSTVRVFADTAKAQASSMARMLGDAAVATGRATARSVGIALPRTAQQVRLSRFRGDAQQVTNRATELFEQLPDLSEARIAAAVGPVQPEHCAFSPAQRDQLLRMREAELGTLLRELRKIGIRERVIAPDFSALKDRSAAATASNASYRLAERWRSARTAVSTTAKRAGLRHSDDLLPALDRSLAALAAVAADQPETLSAHEAELLLKVREISGQLKAAGVCLPAIQPDPATGTGGARHALRSACLLGSLVEYDALLRTDTVPSLQQAEERQKASALRSLSKLGLSSWQELEAFDDVVATFREQIATPGTARRLQLLKSLGLPADAAPDEMASRMTDLLQDLFNRSTFFSVASKAAELRGALGYPIWAQINPINVGAGGEAIHALGVERIGDSKDGDAGLVAFFVRHAKGNLSATSSVKIKLDPLLVSLPLYENKASGTKSSLGWGSSASLSLGGAYQHGVGAAVILSPSTIPEFARLLFDQHDPDTSKLLRAGVNEGAIGLDLFETNFNASTALGMPEAGLSDSRQYGAQKPAADPAHPPATSAANGRSSLSGNLSTGATWRAGMHWSEMELHLDHAWTDIIGLEFQGRADFSMEGNLSLSAGGQISSAFGAVFRNLITALTNVGSLQLGSVRVACGDVQLPLDAALSDAPDGPVLGTASYKRTLDAKAASPITPASWQHMADLLRTTFPEGAAELDSLDYPLLPSERIAFLEHVIDRVQGEGARTIEAQGALEGAPLRLQSAQARAATREAAGSLWHSRSGIKRAIVLQLLHELRQEESLAARHRARLIPGARVELNMFGRESLDKVVTHALGHSGLGSKMGDLAEVRRQINGLDDVLRRFKDIPYINQVRFVFEMRPQAMTVINDALAAKAQEEGTDMLGISTTASGMDWRSVLDKTRNAPDLYRLAAIAVHNTDSNMVGHQVGLPLVNLSTNAGTSHQLFEAEIQFRYGLYDQLQGAEVLEAGGRALQQRLQLDGTQAIGRQAIARSSQFGPPSPRGKRPSDAASSTTSPARSDHSHAQQLDPQPLPYSLHMSPRHDRIQSPELEPYGDGGPEAQADRERVMAEIHTWSPSPDRTRR
ncbi:transducer protein car [Xanthomonas translucens]|uniref:transducer protein car n=2 Tax=Xanthomonas campestris pv. translucens TaxID=343 RepID=UPI001E3B1DD0|nr:transducer protein car [Xanthomonas translucens]MCS3358488.1 transducer protein car [Xanthomonas translucens pv. translucens]MCS3372020.1 transducer protein car [Xanthomonas translucens pv. translucens]MCT8271883.1 transducer protein car [Xanthomonas translucens pv. undulosa]MCT8280610.1 transducer protein car [Xanthomonas translucens pv. undulosa]MCT8288036.1 transducer protein car [Xanthomonas translucens pv. translucens]